MRASRIFRRLGTFAIFLWIAGLVIILLVLLWFRLAAHFQETRADVPLTGHVVSGGDTNMFVQEAGPIDGVPVVFIHGTGAWSEMWRQTLDAVAQRGYHAIAIDIPPFGFSARPGVPSYTTEDQAARIVGVLKAMKIQGVMLVGHSFGSRATLQAAVDAPEYVRGIVLVDPALNLGSTATAPMWMHVLFDARPIRNVIVASTLTNVHMTKYLLQMLIFNKNAATPARVSMLQQPMMQPGTTNAVGDWLMQLLFGSDAAFQTCMMQTPPKAPIHMIWGEQDTITPLAQASQLQAVFSGSTLSTMPNVGHIPYIEAPEQFNTLLLDILDSSVGR